MSVADQNDRAVGWRLYDVSTKNFREGQWPSQREASKAKTALTGGKRNPTANWLRVKTFIVGVLADGTSPQAQEIQAWWDSR